MGKELIKDVDAGQLIAQAIDKGLPIDTMERLLAMRRELKAEAAKEAFFSALSNFQSECPEIPKTKTVMNKDGRTVRYKYAPLETIISAVKAPLKKNGFSHTIKTKQDNGNVTAICRLHHIEGHTEETELTVPIDRGGYMSAPQQVAAALTYAKRYAFCDATGIMTADEDTDATPDNADQGPKQTSKQKTQKSRNEERQEMIDEIAKEIKKHNFNETELTFYRAQVKSAPTHKLPDLLKEIQKAGAFLPPDDHADEVEGTVEDFTPQAEELPLKEVQEGDYAN